MTYAPSLGFTFFEWGNTPTNPLTATPVHSNFGLEMLPSGKHPNPTTQSTSGHPHTPVHCGFTTYLKPKEWPKKFYYSSRGNTHSNMPHCSTRPARSYFTSNRHPGGQVTPHDISSTVKNTALILGLARYKIHPEDVSSHSLRAGGAMAIHLGGASATTIKISGRWSSDTFPFMTNSPVSQQTSPPPCHQLHYHTTSPCTYHHGSSLITDPLSAGC
jgi:hypothetical protein